jgi:protein-S-isoprenylcysteine O-methyltransferase Ste14
MLSARPAYAPVLGLEALYFSLQLVGAAAAVYSLSSLGRSFGLVAANRGIRTGGPYGIVRHPLYVSFFITDVGYILENPSPWNIAVLMVVAAAQLARIATEEDCLRGDPAYVRYCERVRYRLVPYVW